MRPVPQLVHVLLLAVSVFVPTLARTQETIRFRQWMMGVESGGMEIQNSRNEGSEQIRTRQWTRLERALSQDSSTAKAVIELGEEDTATRSPNGELTFRWKATLSDEPMEGVANWNPKAPGKLRVAPKHGEARELDVPEGALLWPGDTEARLREAARQRQAIRLIEFAFSEQQWTRLEADLVGMDPLPGFPDAIHYKGQDRTKGMAMDIDLWISPRHGEIKRLAQLAGIPLLIQRAELPDPRISNQGGLFERTLAQLPPHPFMLWMPEATLRWNGNQRQELPEDPQQTRISDGCYRVRRASLPEGPEAEERPIKGSPSADDAPFLASTPLVPFRDPAFDGLLARLNAPEGASRWELAQRVTHFVYDWITQKDMTVGFASALEVAHHAKGDCTEHGVLAVALLRRLGVPARGVVGWVGLENMVGLHFWVEFKTGGRWIPIDPTFDLALASSLRLKMGTTDLADLGSLGWDTATLSLVNGNWRPEGAWTSNLRLEGDGLIAPDGTILRLPGAAWKLSDGTLRLATPACELEATLRPDAAHRSGARLLMGARSGRKGWFGPNRQLHLDAGDGRWLLFSGVSESEAFRLLDDLEIRPR
ncbi:MAG TPA: transglutaminase-like domain-containing protein [Holophaga sp.]|nr:transglutaminase-like domain-containing protein [Holophaga sp.]